MNHTFNTSNTSQRSGSVTSTEIDAYNTLLTQLSLVIDHLQEQIVIANDSENKYPASYSDNTKNNAHLEDVNFTVLDLAWPHWEHLLMDVKIAILPELYVVFNNPKELTTARRRLYDRAQAIYYALLSHLNAALDAYDSTSSVHSATLADIANQITTDSYISIQGKNALIANELLELSKLAKVDAINYLDKFEPYYTILIEPDSLKQFLRSHSQQSLIEQLDQWQQNRFSAFSVITQQAILREPDLMNSRLDHSLASWLLRDILGQRHFPETLKQEKAFINDTNKNGVIIGFSIFGLVSLATIFMMASSNMSAFAFSVLIGIPGSLVSLLILSKNLNFRHHYQGISSASTVSLLIAFFMMFFGMPFTMIAIFTFILGTGLKIVNKISYSSYPKYELPLATSTVKVVQRSTKYKQPIYDEGRLSLNEHAYYLGILLSPEPTERLQQLIIAMNELHDNLSYLHAAYPYLATRVRELIKDLSHNTVARLNELASQFVTQGVVNKEIEALFARQHETRIDTLITLNLKQVKDINSTILEKKLAVFEDVGSSQEHPFRDAVMELKILLRWLIAQQPNELQASSHQVILDNLESSTLKDMQAVFFDNKTNTKQREILLSQVQTMLVHFKQQSPYALDVSSGHVDSAAQQTTLDNLLQLSKSKDDKSVKADEHLAVSVDELVAQTKTQEFIAFNQAYIGELVKHWH